MPADIMGCAASLALRVTDGNAVFTGEQLNCVCSHAILLLHSRVARGTAHTYFTLVFERFFEPRGDTTDSSRQPSTPPPQAGTRGAKASAVLGEYTLFAL